MVRFLRHEGLQGIPNIPFLQRIEFEDLEYSHQDGRLRSQNSHSLFGAFAEDAFNSIHAKPVDYVARQAEWHLFRRWQSLAL
jgi:hypothetical protein